MLFIFKITVTEDGLPNLEDAQCSSSLGMLASPRIVTPSLTFNSRKDDINKVFIAVQVLILQLNTPRMQLLQFTTLAYALWLGNSLLAPATTF